MSMLSELKKIKEGEPLRQQMRIGGKLVGNERLIEVLNPYNGKLVGTVPKATVGDIRDAFRIARQFKSKLTRFERSRIMLRAAEILRANTDAVSDLITAEAGLCKKDSLYEVGRACDVFVFAANQALVDDGQVFSCDLTPHGKQRKVYTMKEPLLGAI
ncbi:MAG: putative phosphonoacetaldehyde dehydrogenase, partial [Collimonas fungivorans]|uniref:aldehyde dehydrogenase family protein n=1 Tax=Collimonas fungivorans TaxID=158899 RepID=UPI0026EE7510